MRKSEDLEIVECPIVKAPCIRCPLWTRLEDWEGCTLAVMPKWVYEIVRDAAGALDRLLNLDRRK